MQAMAENAAYLAQLEGEGQTEAVYGSGVQLIVPEPAYVIKTKDITGQTRVYINICTSPKVGEMELKQSADPSKRGVHLSLPMAMQGKEGRSGKASDGGAVMAWDLTVHPGAVKAASANPKLKEEIVNLAIERVEQLSRLKLLRQYKLPIVKYRAVGGVNQPPVMAVRSGDGGQVVDGRLRPAASAPADPTSAHHAQGNGTASSKSSGRSSFNFGKTTVSQKQQMSAKASDNAHPLTPGYQHSCGAVTPQWHLVERDAVTDLGQAWQDSGRGLAQTSRTPQALIIRVQLPGIASAAGVNLHTSSDRLHVEVPGKYILNLPLKHMVLDDQGSARLDKGKQELTMTLPVAPQSKQQQAAAQREQLGQQVQQQLQQYKVQQKQKQIQGGSAGNTAATPASAVHESSHAGVPAKPFPPQQPASEAAAEHSNLGQAEGPGGVASAPDATAVVSLQGPKLASTKTANQERWEQLHEAVDSQSRSTEQPADASQQQQHQRNTDATALDACTHLPDQPSCQAQAGSHNDLPDEVEAPRVDRAFRDKGWLCVYGLSSFCGHFTGHCAKSTCRVCGTYVHKLVC
eukprot:GHRR01004545.1.p1 GENE.GHRR01004545.1~~GHRR01004545.1.p1  ORF type:complete len:574 (+),score=212.43 GHRR01004545.1:586-2307(+)